MKSGCTAGEANALSSASGVRSAAWGELKGPEGIRVGLTAVGQPGTFWGGETYN
jgi:hypothetical protein